LPDILGSRGDEDARRQRWVVRCRGFARQRKMILLHRVQSAESKSRSEVLSVAGRDGLALWFVWLRRASTRKRKKAKFAGSGFLLPGRRSFVQVGSTTCLAGSRSVNETVKSLCGLRRKVEDGREQREQRESGNERGVIGFGSG
jgi:hypothetical protein